MDSCWDAISTHMLICYCLFNPHFLIVVLNQVLGDFLKDENFLYAYFSTDKNNPQE